MRLLPVSATQSRNPWKAIPAGSFSCPLALPSSPNLARTSACGLNFSTRLLARSTTKKLVPPVVVIPIGSAICPSALPAAPAWQTLPEAAVQRVFSSVVPPASTFVLLTLEPITSTKAPLELNWATRLLAVSVASRLPAESIAMAEGRLSLPPVEPRPPASRRNSPASLYSTMRLLALSTAQMLPAASTATSDGRPRPVWLELPFPIAVRNCGLPHSDSHLKRSATGAPRVVLY